MGALDAPIFLGDAMKGRVELASRIEAGFTLVEMLVVIAIVGVLIAVGVPVVGAQLDRARNQVDLANMRTAYGLAAAEWMTQQPEGVVAYFFNGTSLQPTAQGITGYGQSTSPAVDFSDGFPSEVTGTPNTFGKSNFIVVYCDAQGVGRVSWGAGAYTGRQITTPEAHEAMDLETAEKLDEDLLDDLQAAAQSLTYGELKALIAKYGIRKDGINGHTAIQIAICNVDPETRLPDQSKTKIYVPELFDSAGYDVTAENLYVINSRDGHLKGDIIWLDLGTNIDRAADGEKAAKAFTYVKSNGDVTNDRFRYDFRRIR